MSLTFWIPLLWYALWLVFWNVVLGHVPMTLEVDFAFLNLWVPPDHEGPTYLYVGVPVVLHDKYS